MVKDYVNGSSFTTEPLVEPLVDLIDQPIDLSMPAQSRLVTRPKTVRLLGMEINLSALGELLMKPFFWGQW
jgi:hypothetical protein